MKLTERKKMVLIHIAWILALAVILWPLFTIAKYDYPSADDWSFGKYMYRAMQAGEGITGVFHAIYQTLAQNVWEARFSILILSALQPAAFGEHFYRITPYLMIGSVILSQFLLLREGIAGQAKENRWLILPIGIPMAILQVLYCPYPEESFYWYNGSVNYTFVYSLSLVLLTLYLEIALRETGKAKRVVLTVLACLLAILVGGNNFSTSVSTMCLLICLQILFLICRKDAFRRTWIVTLLETLSVLMCVTSPLTATRLNGNFGGSTANSPLMAIWLSLERTFLNIISWTNLKVLLLLVLLIPFLWKAVRKMNYEFRFPGLFTALTFGVYASQATATIYVDGTMGGGRQGAILWYFYVLWMVANVLYWLDRKAGSESGKERKGRPVGTEIPPALFCSDGGTSGSSCSVRQCPEHHQLPCLPHVEKRLGTGLRRRLGRADRSAEGRFREKSGIPTAELCGTAHVYRSAAREWLCVGKYGLRGVLWEGICDGGSRDGGRIKSYNKIK